MTNTVCCVKYGTKYPPEYVNNLYSMLKRNLTVPFQFCCFTDDSKGFSKGIISKPLIEPRFKGWWQKPAYFKSPFPLENATKILSLDLDMIIIRNIDCLFTDFNDNDFCAIKDHLKQNGNNSSIMRWNVNYSGHLEKIYTNLINNPDRIYAQNTGEDPSQRPKKANSRYWGDQIWITDHTKDIAKLYNPDYVKSYRYVYKKNPDVFNDETTKIILFHGTMKPHNCNDPKLKEIWRSK